jgi:alginate O-acetyltransferase complex protein AlgI
VIFNTFVYYLLFLFPCAIAYRCSRSAARPWIIASFGSLFFLHFAYGMAGVAGALCLCIFVWESITSRLYRPGSPWCLLGILQSVLFLCVFKYLNFATGLIFWHQADPLLWHGAFLPLGISFFTFEFYHYAWDRNYNRTEAGTLGEYLAFILFFPTMVAGPIKRYQDFLPKLRAEPGEWTKDWEIGWTRILTGLVKKFAIADVLSAWTDHLNAHDIRQAGRGYLLLWLFAYSIKVYADFSGYSDIAIGSARLFGIRVPENFDWPYGRRNIQRFWACWHMSLTRWLTDYVFLPIARLRLGSWRTQVYIAIVGTMLVSGLWHGAGLHYIAWGLYNGLLLLGHKMWRDWRGPASDKLIPVVASRVLTFSCVTAGYALFTMDLHTVLLFYTRLLIG